MFARFSLRLVIMVTWLSLCALSAQTVLSQRSVTRVEANGVKTVTAPSAVALVQTITGCAGSTLTSSFTSTFFAGGAATKNNLLVVAASSRNAATISTPAGYTQVFLQQTQNAAPSLALFYKIASGGETGVTVNYGAANSPCVGIAEYSGTSINAPLHGKSLGLLGSGTTLGTGTIDIISPTDLGVAAFSNNNTTFTSSYTNPPAPDHFTDETFGGSFGGATNAKVSMVFADCIANCLGTTSTTITNGGDWRGFIASFYPKTTTATTGSGSSVTATSGNATVIFPNVSSSGTLTTTSIDPTNPSQGAAPSGTSYTSASPAYDISTTAVFSGTVKVCVKVDGIPPANFNNLKLLHKEGPSLVDRTSQVNASTQNVCGNVTSFSPFIVANGSSPSAANVSVTGRVLTSSGVGIRNATVLLTDPSGNVRSARTSAFGYYTFDGVEAGQTYVVKVASRTYVFIPQVVNVSDTLSGVDLIASP